MALKSAQSEEWWLSSVPGVICSDLNVSATGSRSDIGQPCVTIRDLFANVMNAALTWTCPVSRYLASIAGERLGNVARRID